MDIYYHFTSFKDASGVTKKYCVTTTADKTSIIRCIELKPVLQEEKENPSQI